LLGSAFDQVQLPAADPSRGAVEGVVVPAQATAVAAPAVPVIPPLSAAEVRAIVEPLLQEQGIELRRFVVASLDGVSARLVTELDERLRRAVAELDATIIKATEPQPLPEPPAPPRPTGWIVLAGVALVAATTFGVLAWQARGELATARVTPLPAAVATGPAAVPTDAPADVPAPPVVAATAPAAHVAPIPVRRLSVAYGDAPLASARLAAIGGWIADLERRGFAGVARVSVSAGEFCLTGNPGEGYTPAPGELPANRCDVVGNPADDAQRAGDREPAAFVALASALRERSHGDIDLRLVWVNRTGAVGYPPATDANASQWNAVAQSRNVVELVADPRAATP
jgi:hypothetical protein